MLACLLQGPGKAVLQEVPIPKFGEKDVLVRLEGAGICGTDVEKLDGGLGPGGILGHEVSATVERLGESVEEFSKGDRVVAHHHVPCYNCHYCSRGDYTMCDFFKKTNFDPCGLAEFFRVPEENVERGAIIRIPDEVDFEEAALAEPTACCLRAIKRVGVDEGDTALVVGLGLTGLTHVQLLKHYVAGKIIGTDVSHARLEMARRLGASMAMEPVMDDVEPVINDETNIGVDIAVVAAGNPRAFTQAM